MGQLKHLCSNSSKTPIIVRSLRWHKFTNICDTYR